MSETLPKIHGIPDIPEGYGPDLYWGVPPVNESVCLYKWSPQTWFTPKVKFTEFYLHARKTESIAALEAAADCLAALQGDAP